MATFKTRDSSQSNIQNVTERNISDESLSLFEKLILKMISKNRSLNQIVQFTKTPSGENYGIAEDSLSPLLVIFEQIKKFSSSTERLEILKKLSEQGKLPSV